MYFLYFLWEFFPQWWSLTSAIPIGHRRWPEQHRSLGSAVACMHDPLRHLSSQFRWSFRTPIVGVHVHFWSSRLERTEPFQVIIQCETCPAVFPLLAAAITTIAWDMIIQVQISHREQGGAQRRLLARNWEMFSWIPVWRKGGDGGLPCRLALAVKVLPTNELPSPPMVSPSNCN